MDEQNLNNSFFEEKPKEAEEKKEETEATFTENKPEERRADFSYIYEAPKKKKEKKAKKEKGHFFTRFLAACLCGVLFGACAAGSFFAVNKYVIKEDTVKATETDVQLENLQKTVDDLKKAVNTRTSQSGEGGLVISDVSDVAEKVMPSMVAIKNMGEYTTSDWFGRRYTQETESAGSGIIIGESDQEYFIATNHHVIEGSKQLSVIFYDDATVDAYVKGYDTSIDIAVIAVSKENVSDETKRVIDVAELGNSDTLRIGEPAIAIGNALGYGQSVTTGVVSALNRDMDIDSVKYEGLIQTSAAINPGNSGGALLNVNGQVIGINSSKVGGSTVEGMGFAIPISKVRDILQEFSDREVKVKVADDKRGYLGISGNDTYDLTALGYPEGVYVAKVFTGSPAEQYGLFMGDIITKVDSQSVKTISELSEFLSYYKAGDTVKLSVTRNVSGVLTDLDIEVVLGDKEAITDKE